MKDMTNPELPAIAGGAPIRTKPYPSGVRYGESELNMLREALNQNTLFYAYGKLVHRMEEKAAETIGVPYAVATSSGTASIHSALMALGISPGDEVIVTPITDMGSLVPILWQGAIPVFADVDPRAYCVTAQSVEDVITDRTRAVIAVHLWGNSCDIEGIQKVCKKHNIHLVEDCAQAWGCEYNGKSVGSYGEIGCFSLNEFKHISCGDGGVVVTSDPDLARKLRLSTDKCYNREPGAKMRSPYFLANNYRMTELQGAVALAQFDKLSGIVESRRKWCEALCDRLKSVEGVLMPIPTKNSNPSWWFYMLRIDPEILGVDADEFAKAVYAEGISCSAHYIGQCIYDYPVFVDHSAYERGTHPYMQKDYTASKCYDAETVLKTAIIIPTNENNDEELMNDVANAIERVAKYFVSKNSKVPVKA